MTISTDEHGVRFERGATSWFWPWPPRSCTCNGCSAFTFFKACAAAINGGYVGPHPTFWEGQRKKK